jgi:hypothetical protein
MKGLFAYYLIDTQEGKNVLDHVLDLLGVFVDF